MARVVAMLVGTWGFFLLLLVLVFGQGLLCAPAKTSWRQSP